MSVGLLELIYALLMPHSRERPANYFKLFKILNINTIILNNIKYYNIKYYFKYKLFYFIILLKLLFANFMLKSV